MLNTGKASYTILGIPEGSGIESIKKAYRRKAKELHPDRNKASDAQERFIELNEAYEYLLDLKYGRISKTRKIPSPAKNTHQTQQEQVRERAKAYARMRYEEYLRSDHYKSSQAAVVVFDFFILIISLSFLIALLIFAPIYFGISGFWIALLIFLSVSPLIKRMITRAKEIHIHDLKQSFYHLSTRPGFWVLIISLVNIYVFMRIALQTLITPGTFLFLYMCYPLLLYFSGKYLKKGVKIRLLITTYGVLLISLFLLLNYIFSSGSYTETYRFTNEDKNGNRSTYIRLSHNAYQAYPGIRIFIDYQKIYGNNQIEYTLSDGLLGYKVMKDYRFEFVSEKRKR